MKGDTLIPAVLSFLAGVAVGTALGVLIAPESGRRTRRRIVRTAEDVQDYLEELGEDLVERGRELIERGRQAADETVRGIGKKVRTATT